MPSPEFDAAADNVNKLTKKPEQDELLKLYGLYKQATEGDNNTARPGAFDFKGKYKWDAWTANNGMSREDAESAYIEFVKELQVKYA